MSCLLCDRVRRVHNTRREMLNASETHSYQRKIHVTHAMHAVTKQVVRRWKEQKRRAMTTCKGCRWLVMTWAESRRSYARLVAHGLSAEGAKSKSPLCHHSTGALRYTPDGAACSATCSSNPPPSRRASQTSPSLIPCGSSLSSATSQRTRRGRGRLSTRSPLIAAATVSVSRPQCKR